MRYAARRQGSTDSTREAQMGKLRKKVMANATTAARRTAAGVKKKAAEVETRLLVEEGRRSVRAKSATAKKVAKTALKAGLLAGVATAAAVVVHEVRKRRKP